MGGRRQLFSDSENHRRWSHTISSCGQGSPHWPSVPQRPKGQRSGVHKRAVVFIPNKVITPTKVDLLRTELALIAALPPMEPGLTIQSIRPNQCRYMNGDPQSDGTLCGRLTAAGSWCSQHRKLVYQPSKPKARLTRSVEGDEKRRQLRELTRREQFQMGAAV
jgi:hypothetical protein